MGPYLIWSHEHGAWWRAGMGGYTRRLSEAMRFDRELALAVCGAAMPGTSTLLGALPDLPIALADVEAIVEAYDSTYPGRDEPWR